MLDALELAIAHRRLIRRRAVDWCRLRVLTHAIDRREYRCRAGTVRDCFGTDRLVPGGFEQ